MSEVKRDMTKEPKAVENNEWVYNPISNTFLKVIDTYETIAFKTKKNIAKLNDNSTFVNTYGGLDNINYDKWIPQVNDFIILSDSITQDSFDTRRVQFFNEKLNEVVLYDGSKVKLSNIEPFRGLTPYEIRK